MSTLDNDVILKMFSSSTFSISSELYVYTKVKTIPKTTDHFLITQDKDEITVVTPINKLDELEILEKNDNLWYLISLNLETPFMVGTLATINLACAKKGLNNLIVSTYSKDYILIKESQLSRIESTLKELGFKASGR